MVNGKRNKLLIFEPNETIFFDGTYNFPDLAGITIASHYPYEPNVRISILPHTKEPFEIAIRIPEELEQAYIRIGDTLYHPKGNNFFYIRRFWQVGDEITFAGTFPVKCHLSPKTSKENDKTKLILTKGPLVLSRDSTLDDTQGNAFIYEPFPSFAQMTPPPHTNILLECQGSLFCDYASAGNQWDNEESAKVRVWLR